MTSLSTYTTVTTSSKPNCRIIQNFRLVWLDNSFDEVNNDDFTHTMTKLRQTINTVQNFTDIDECIDFITDIENEKIFMICSEELDQTVISVIQGIAQINRIYIFCKNIVPNEEWTKDWRKIEGVYTDITSICKALKQAARFCDQNTVSLSFLKSTDGISNQNLNQLDRSFMYTQLLKESLLIIDYEQDQINEFLTYCREQFVSNITELNNVDKLEKEYHHHPTIWWYTYNCFLYSMINRALRLMEVDLIIKMGFFLRDLHNHIATLHSEQYSEPNQSNAFIIYRGQGLSSNDFDQLRKTKGGLMSFNNFLSTSLDRDVSFLFAESNTDDPDLIGVFFEITVDPSIPSSPFANIKDVSYFQEEEP